MRKSSNINNIDQPGDSSATRPILKWAGGKSQLLKDLLPKLPKRYGRYIEPFFGGGALFFAVKPQNAVIADSNPELINLYKTVASDVDSVIYHLKVHENSKEYFYEVRKQEWTNLSPASAAARTIFLNKTCFNGLYRVNKKGQFNTPYGRYVNPRILDEQALRTAAILLRRATIVCGDYKVTLKEHACKNDFVFLDPPYLPVSESSDFKRYTKEQFYEKDHAELAEEIDRLQKLGCHVILTNSNHPLVNKMYHLYDMQVINTKRHISSNGKGRKGQDVIINIIPKVQLNLIHASEQLPERCLKYPPTRFMGSKKKLLKDIWSVASQLRFDTVVDLFSGSGIVGYMFKTQGKAVISNDYMHMSATFTKAMIENNNVRLPIAIAEQLLKHRSKSDRKVENTFKGLYFEDQDNKLIDTLRSNIKSLTNPYEKAIAMSALIRSCTKKRPRGLFTYTGMRYDDGRRDIHLPIAEHFIEAIEAINNAIFDNNKKNLSMNVDALNVLPVTENALVYIDPPYYTPHSDNEYVRRYHFVEGLARDWKGVEIQEHTKTKKFKSYATPFSSRKGAYDAFDQLFRQFSKNCLIVSYSSNGLPTKDVMYELLKQYKQSVEIVPLDYKYSIGTHGHKVGDNKNDVKEYLFVGN